MCDECHQIKNPATAANKLVRQLDRDANLLVSATPMPNHIRDIKGYLRVLWDPAWLFKYEQKEDPTPADTSFRESVYAGLFGLSIKLDVQTPLTLKRVLSGRMKSIDQLTAREKVRAKQFKDFVQKQKGAAYML